MKTKKYNVYPIVNGCSKESDFTGTLRQCIIFTKRKKALNKNYDWILLEEDKNLH